MSPMTATLSPSTGAQIAASSSGGHVQHLLALAGHGHDLVLGHDEAVAARARDEELAAGLMNEQLDRVGRLLDVDHEAERLAVPPAARQFVGAQRVEAAIGGEEEQRVGGLGSARRASAGRPP